MKDLFANTRFALALVVAAGCSGAAFTSVVDDNADASAQSDAGGAAGDATAAGDGASSGDAAAASDAASGEDRGAMDAGSHGDGSVCCAWVDAGKHFTSCGPGDWGCPNDAGGFATCYGSSQCVGQMRCVLNDDSHGLVWGTIEPCP